MANNPRAWANELANPETSNVAYIFRSSFLGVGAVDGALEARRRKTTVSRESALKELPQRNSIGTQYEY